jgi:hypothetical protein
MKKICILFLIGCMLVATSCTHTLYNPKVLQGNYDLRMDSKEELEIKNKVRIFLSEDDIQGAAYDVISVNVYRPFTIPLFMSFKGKTTKKFYEKAVKKAYEQGGNAIVVTAAGMYKVLSLHDWDSDIEGAAKYINAILDTTLMDRFNNGEIAKLSPREIKRYVTDLTNEVHFNIKTMKTSVEAEVVGKKIVALQNWNNSQEKLNVKFSKRLNRYQKIHKILQKRIIRKEAKNK